MMIASSEFDNLLLYLLYRFRVTPPMFLQESYEEICKKYFLSDGSRLSQETSTLLKEHIQSPAFKNRFDYMVTIQETVTSTHQETRGVSIGSVPQQTAREAEIPAAITASSLFCARQITAQLAEISSNLDIGFCIDGTWSMEDYIVAVKETIMHVSSELAIRTGMLARFALVVYRDYCDDTLRKELQDFSSCADFQSALARIVAKGGGDVPEDCFGGLWAAATELEWKAPARVLIWMGDAPQHGAAYNAGLQDDHPDEPDTHTSAQIFTALRERHITLVFCKLTLLTDCMVAQLKEESKPYGANRFLEYNLQGDVGEFLVKVLHSTVALTSTNGTENLGPLKAYQITPATWEIDNLWGPEEEAIIITSFPYGFSGIHPLLDLITADQAVSYRQVKCRFTLQPVDKGEMRIAFRAIITENDTALPQLFGIAKESRYEGTHNGKENLKNQAKIQAVAAFLAAEFTIKLRKIRPDYWCYGVEYIPVEIIRLPERPEGKHYMTYETFLPGEYYKFSNNRGYVDKTLETNNWLPQTFSHFTYVYSRGMLLVSDLQGIISTSEFGRIHCLTDPAVHTSDSRYLVDPTNLGATGIQAFFSSHICNRICEEMQLHLPDQASGRGALDLTDVMDAISIVANFSPTFSPNS